MKSFILVAVVLLLFPFRSSADEVETLMQQSLDLYKQGKLSVASQRIRSVDAKIKDMMLSKLKTFLPESSADFILTQSEKIDGGLSGLGGVGEMRTYVHQSGQIEMKVEVFNSGDPGISMYRLSSAMANLRKLDFKEGTNVKDGIAPENSTPTLVHGHPFSIGNKRGAKRVTLLIGDTVGIEVESGVNIPDDVLVNLGKQINIPGIEKAFLN